MSGYIAGIYGAGPLFVSAWGGALTSNGITRAVDRAKAAHGLDGACFNFDQVQPVADGLFGHDPSIIVCYSLGVTAGTYYTTRRKLKTLICIAGSKLGRNYPVDQTNVQRAVLIRGSGTLSGWGEGAGFHQIYDYPGVPHLLMDLAEGVQRIVDMEVATTMTRPAWPVDRNRTLSMGTPQWQ